MKSYIKKIQDKKFESVINGYSPSSVDSFLDSIVKDINNFEIEKNNLENEITSLNETIENLKKRNKELEKEILDLKNNQNKFDETKKEENLNE